MLDVLKEIPRPNQQLFDTIRDIGIHDHACLLYRDSEEGLVSSGTFIQAGLEQNDQCIYIVDDNDATDVIHNLTSRGIDVNAAIASGQLVIGGKQDSYLRDGLFDPDQSIAFFAQAASDAQSSKYRAVRGCAEMTWQLGGEPGTERLLEYESKMNKELFPKHKAVGMCQFNLSRFSPVSIREVIYTHPLVIIGGLVCENMYYKAAGEYRSAVTGNNAEIDVARMLKEIFALAKLRYSLA